MDISLIIQDLSKNKETLHALLTMVEDEEILWKADPSMWCLLEVVCHLYDEEREDFRARANHLLQHPGVPPPLFDQLAWVTERKYIEQDYRERLKEFLSERAKSIQWLQSHQSASWHNAFHHQKLGVITAGYYLTNWVAHDLLHMRQILKIKYLYLQDSGGMDLSYAGNW